MNNTFIFVVIFSFMVVSCSTMPKPPEISTRGDYDPVEQYVFLLIRKQMKKEDIT
jgi:hypothetical protein